VLDDSGKIETLLAAPAFRRMVEVRFDHVVDALVPNAEVAERAKAINLWIRKATGRYGYEQ
jgi:hypothetical protein